MGVQFEMDMNERVISGLETPWWHSASSSDGISETSSAGENTEKAHYKIAPKYRIICLEVWGSS